MTFLGKTLVVAIPDTVLEEHDSPRDKTVKLGQIARACAIFGVDSVEVFRDKGGRDESKRITKVLEYLETPQYLRKRIFPLDEDLRFAGLLPPLRTPSHKPRVSFDDLEVGEVREGITNADGTVDIGLERPPSLVTKSAPDRRVTVRVTSKKPFQAEAVGKEAAGRYWGYAVERKTVEEVLEDRRAFLRIATSRLGDPVSKVRPQLETGIAKAGGVKLLFGSPSRGLFEIVGKSLREKVEFVVNLYSEQHVETVRTEEAISAALNLINFLSK